MDNAMNFDTMDDNIGGPQVIIVSSVTGFYKMILSGS